MGQNQHTTKLPDETFIHLFETLGASEMARQLGMDIRSLYKRRNNVSKRIGRYLVNPASNAAPPPEHPQRATLEVKNGHIIVGSDFHIWPGVNGPALRAFKKFIDNIRPAAVVLNGDVLDFPRISRHPPIGWTGTPSPRKEIEAAQDHLNDIAKAARRARKIWSLGNHDSRFETKLATVAPEFGEVPGTSLKDHFALWEPCWSVWVNDNTVIKHRFKGGIHAPHNNTMWAGKTMVTGHLHSQKVTPFTDYNGTRYGVDTGCVADPSHKAFVDYTEDNPLNWRSGFGVLSYKDSQLLMPELVQVWDERSVQFRGEVHKV